MTGLTMVDHVNWSMTIVRLFTNASPLRRIGCLHTESRRQQSARTDCAQRTRCVSGFVSRPTCGCHARRCERLVLINLDPGFRQLTMRMVVGSQNMVVTPDLKYYAFAAPNYLSDLYLVENLK
jgi:hypothetical protein